MRMLAWITIAIGSAVAAAQTPITLQTVATGLERPIYVTHAPGDYSRIFVIEKRGRIRIVKDGTLLATPFLDMDAEVGGGTSTGDERGLLGLAFHPNYQSNGLFYVYYTRNNGNTAVAQYSVTANPDVADASSNLRMIVMVQPQTNHNGGWIEFGPDGYLYIATGDGGGGGDDDPGHTDGVGNSQDITDNLLGKILRIDIDGDDFPELPNTNYAVPADNPFVGVTGDDEIWAFGLRNPWRCSFDRETGDLWIADVGQFTWEEISFQPAASTGGENYGWRCREGAHDFNTSGDCSQTPFTEPIFELNHAAGRCSITGGYVYRGCAIPDLQGTYFFADYCANDIWTLEYDGVAVSNFTLRTELNTNSITSFGEDAFGELYVCNQNGGQVRKIVPDGVPSACNMCVDTNGDMQTDLTDLATLLANFGTQIGAKTADGDTDGDGDVDLTDLATLLASFGCTP